MFYILTGVLLPSFALILYLIISYTRRHSAPSPSQKKTVKLMAVMGSGGHTTEMIELLRNLDGRNYSPRTYVAAESDKLSEMKVTSFEHSRNGRDFSVEKVPRSRGVGQSYFSSVFTTLYAVVFSFVIVYKHRPQLLLLNGPGTCIPIAVAAALLDLLRLQDVVIVYEESICRVNTLSLSGLIMYHTRLADEFIVQWKQLNKKYPRTKLIDQL